jgi:hypothetical protein
MKDVMGIASGSFFTRPAVPEVKIFLTFDETSAAQMLHFCQCEDVPLARIAERLGVRLGARGPSNIIFNPDDPIVVRNPDGVTTEDVVSSLKVW